MKNQCIKCSHKHTKETKNDFRAKIDRGMVEDIVEGQATGEWNGR